MMGHHDHDHSHSHAHGHAHAHHAGLSSKRLLWLTLLSFSYMVAEVIGGFASGSLALLADAGHMAVDVAAMALSLFAMWVAKRPPTSEKTYGYYRAEILAALLNGASLVAVSLWIIYEASLRMAHPAEINGQLMGAVAGGGLLVNLVGLLLVRQQRKENLNLQSVWLHLMTDALGSVASLVAAVLVVKLGWTKADPILSILMSLSILYGAWQLLSECVNVLLEGVPRGLDLAKVRRGLAAFPAVEDVHDLHVWTVAQGVSALSAHLKVKENVDYCQTLEMIIKFLDDEFKIEHVTLQLEPPEFWHREEGHIHH